jgi:hypothetical protein
MYDYKQYIYTVFLTGNLPNVRLQTVHIYGSGHPFLQLILHVAVRYHFARFHNHTYTQSTAVLLFQPDHCPHHSIVIIFPFE